jgi:hypothetical protein
MLCYQKIFNLQRILFLLFLFFYIFCTPPQSKRNLQLPTNLEPPILFTPQPSIINVPLELKSWYIENLLNERLSGLLYECDTLSLGDFKGVSLKIWKKDSIKIDLKGKELSYKIPIKIWLKIPITINALGISHTEYQEFEAAISLKLKSVLTLASNWKISTTTKVEGYEWLSNAVLKIRFISIPVTPIVDIFLSMRQKSIGEIIDNTINNNMDIKKILMPLWNKIQSPILLRASPDSIWLKLSPSTIYMSQPYGEQQSIKFTCGIMSVTETFFGEKPSFTILDSALPQFIVSDTIDSSCIINLYVDMPFTSVSQILKSQLMGKSFSYKGKEVIVQDINLYGMDGYAVVSIDFTGSFKGKVYVIGRVKYDNTKSIISIEDLDFDLSTKNSFPQTVDWLFHGIILSKVKPLLNFPLKEKILETHIQLQKTLSHFKISNNLYLIASIDSLNLGGALITNNSIKTALLAKGKISILVHN